MKRILEGKCGKNARFGQLGGMLLEVLISILLFALSIVALVGLQVRSLATTSDVQYRAEAMHLANVYIGEIWAAASGGLTGAQIVDQFSTSGSGLGYSNFSSRVTGAHGIPGAQTLPPNVVIVNDSLTFLNMSVNPAVPVAVTIVRITITIRWQDREDTNVIHNYMQNYSIGLNS
jgi:type IV pilus assembly protein PilV